MSLELEQAVTALSGVGPQMAIKLEKVHVHTVQDVLFHLPSRYEDRTNVSPLGSLLPNVSTVVIAQIEAAQVVYGRRRSLLVRVSDGTGMLTIRMFYFNRSQEKSFQRGLWLKCFGEVRPGAKGYEMIHPEYRISSSEPSGGMDTQLTPVYPTTDGVSQALWRKLTDQVLAKALPQLSELLDPNDFTSDLANAHKSITLQDALQQLHRPQAQTNVEMLQGATGAAHQRLIIEELLAHHFSLRKSRALRQQDKAPKLAIENNLNTLFLEQLPFSLTKAQQRVSAEVAMLSLIHI